MSHKGQIQHLEKLNINWADVRLGIVASQFNQEIIGHLLTACLDTLSRHFVPESQIYLRHVPGAFEIPLATQQLLIEEQCDAVITLGAVIRGETMHFDYVCRFCVDGIGRIMLKTNKPVLFGVLMVENIGQAMARAGMDGKYNQGVDVALSALQILNRNPIKPMG